MSMLLDTIYNLAVTMARLQKRLIELEALIETSYIESVPPLPPSRAKFPHVPTPPLAVGLCDMLLQGMRVVVLILRQVSK